MESSEVSLPVLKSSQYAPRQSSNLARRDDGIKPEIAEVSPQFFKDDLC